MKDESSSPEGSFQPAFSNESREETKPPEHIERNWHQSFFEIGDKKVAFYGVSHILETLRYHRKEFETAIKQASTVILETAPQTQNIDSDEFIEKTLGLLKEAGFADITETNVRVWRDKSSGVQFYRALEELVKTYGKQIIVVEPAGDPVSDTRIKKLDEHVQIAKAILSSGGAIGLFLEAYLLGKKRPKEMEYKRNISRRMFLRGTAVVGIGLATASLAENTIKEMSDDPFKDRLTNPLGVMAYDADDYRNVVISHSLKILCEKLPPETNILIVYGDSHREPVEHYIKSPAELALKYNVYAPYWKAAPPKIFRRNQQENGTWLSTTEEL